MQFKTSTPVYLFPNCNILLFKKQFYKEKRKTVLYMVQAIML